MIFIYSDEKRKYIRLGPNQVLKINISNIKTLHKQCIKMINYQKKAGNMQNKLTLTSPIVST